MKGGKQTMCEPKEELYRNLKRAKRDSGIEEGFSPDYVAIVDAIHEHIRCGHNQEPCPDGAL
jgi:hypothetical protein